MKGGYVPAVPDRTAVFSWNNIYHNTKSSTR